MHCIEKNQNVTLIYTLRDWSGEILEQAPHNNPLHYLHGYQQILPALERVLEGKCPGESVEVRLTSDDAFGPYRDDLLVVADRTELSHIENLQVGYELELLQGRFEEMTEESLSDALLGTTPFWEEGPDFHPANDNPPEQFRIHEEDDDDEPLLYVVREIFEESVLLDGNHYLAGYDLLFELKVLQVTPASFDEIEQISLKFDSLDESEDNPF